MISGPSKQQLSHLSFLRSHQGDVQEDKFTYDISCLNSDNEHKVQTPRQLNTENIIVQEHDTKINVINQIEIIKINTDSEQKAGTIEKLDTTKSQSDSMQSQSRMSNLSLSLEIETEKNKLIEFLTNIAFLICFYLVGPFLSSYLLWKYDFLKNLPFSIKVRTVIYVIFKTCTMSLSMWVMIIMVSFGSRVSKNEDYNFYKIEFFININTICTFILGCSILGKSGLFNNKFFSELVYLSEQKLKEVISKKSQSKSGLLNFSTKSHSKHFKDPQSNVQHPLQQSEQDDSEIFEFSFRRKKIQERMTKVMKKLFIDSQTFTFSLLSFNLENPFQQQKVLTSNNIETKENKKEQEQTVQTPDIKVSQKTRKPFQRLQTIKFEQINCKVDSTTSLDLQYQSQEYQNRINGRKLCDELLIYCEKQESLKPKRLFKFFFCSFILLKGFLPCIFRIVDGLGFYGDNIAVGVTCQFNRQMSYSVLIGFLLFSIDLDIMHSFVQITNKLIDYSEYLDDFEDKQEKSKTKKAKSQNEQKSPVSITKQRKRLESITNNNILILNKKLSEQRKKNNSIPQNKNIPNNKIEIIHPIFIGDEKLRTTKLSDDLSKKCTKSDPLYQNDKYETKINKQLEDGQGIQYISKEKQKNEKSIQNDEQNNKHEEHQVQINKIIQENHKVNEEIYYFSEENGSNNKQHHQINEDNLQKLKKADEVNEDNKNTLNEVTEKLLEDDIKLERKNNSRKEQKFQDLKNNIENEGEGNIFEDTTHTPSIDFTDVDSLIAWNNMRKLGFHYKQKDIVLIDRISLIFCLDILVILGFFLVSYFSLIQIGEEYKKEWVLIMLLLDVLVVIYTQLNRVHIQTKINKSYFSSVKAVMQVQNFLKQAHIIDAQKHLITKKFKNSDMTKDDQILKFLLKIKSKLMIREEEDCTYYNKIMGVVQFIQEDIKFDMENDQLKFLGLIKATSGFEATLQTSVVGCLYWLFRVYMKYLDVDIGLLGQ